MMRSRAALPCALATLGVAAMTCLVMLLLIAHPARGQDTNGTRVITLNEALRIALDQNSGVRLARQTAQLDSLSVRQAGNQFLPTLSASAQSSQGYLNAVGSANSLSTSLGLSSGLTLFNGGQNVNTLREAQFTARASGLDLGRAEQTIVFVVASDFLALITQQELLRVQRENLVAQQDQLRQLEAFTKAGTRNIGDLYQQQAATAAAQLGVVNASRTTQLATVDLIQELVLDPRATYVFVAPSSADSGRMPDFNLDSLMTLALGKRVDLEAQRFRIQAAERAIQVAAGGRWPVVSASIGYGSSFNTAAGTDVSSQFSQHRGGSIGVAVSLPIFDRGAVSIATQRALIQLDAQTLALRDQVEAAALDVRRAYLNYQSAQEQLVAATAQQKAAALALEATQARYGVGLATFVEVTLARATFVQAQSAVVTARSNLAFQQALMSYYTGVLDASVAGRVTTSHPT